MCANGPSVGFRTFLLVLSALVIVRVCTQVFEVCSRLESRDGC